MKKTWFALLAAAALLCAMILPVSASGETDGAGGKLIYEETFSYEDDTDSNSVLSKLGWTAQTKENGAYNNPTATFSLSGEKLHVVGSGDSYYLMLTEEDMAPYAGETITIQYEVEYISASNTSRYFCILAHYSGQYYDSFHFRNSGTANNQCHFAGSWKTYDVEDANDLYAAANDKGSTSIAKRLLGKEYNSGVGAFNNIPVTIRYVLDPVEGSTVYMKIADQTEDAFVMVSRQSDKSDGAALYGNWGANAICVKIGGAQTGYMDNIAVWTGDGNYPQPEETVAETEPTEPDAQTPAEDAEDGESNEGGAELQETKVKEPQTIVSKLAVWAVALFGGWIIVKKGKEHD